MPIVAHAGHWLTSIAAVLPLALSLGAVGVVAARDRLQEHREGDERAVRDDEAVPRDPSIRHDSVRHETM